MIKNFLVVSVLIGTAAISVQARSECANRYSVVRPNGTMAYFCSSNRGHRISIVEVESHKSYRKTIRERDISWAERLKKRNPKSLGGHASLPGSIPRQELPFKPVRCKEEIHNLGVRVYQISSWFDMVINGPHNRRVLTSSAAYYVRNKLELYAKSETARAKNKFAAAKRGENADTLCADHLIATNREVTRVFNIVKSEAENGNRDLEGTGLHPRTSIYNK